MTPEQLQERETRLRKAFIDQDFGEAGASLDESAFAGVEDRKRLLMSSAVAGWAGSMMGQRVNPASPDWQGIKDGIARGYFKNREASNVADEELFLQIAEDYKAKDTLAEAARNAAARGESWLGKFREVEQTMPTVAGGRQSSYLGLAREVHDKFREKILPYQGIIKSVAEKARSIETSPEGMDWSGMAQELIQVPKESRPFVLEAISRQATANIDANAASRLGKEFARGFERFLDTAMSGSYNVLAAAGQYSEIPLAPETPQEIEARKARESQDADLMDLRDDIRDISTGKLAKLEDVRLLGMNISGAARNVPMTIGAFVPYIGPAALVGSFQRETANELRRANPTMSRETIEGIATISAPFQALTEVVSDRLLFGKLPNLKRLFTTPAFSAGGIAAQLAGRVALGTATEYAEEFTQGAVPKIVQSLSSDVPDVDWDGYFQDFKDQSPELLATIIPLALFGAGVGQATDYRASVQMLYSADEMMAAKIPAEEARKIAELATTGKRPEAESLFRQEFRKAATKGEAPAEMRAAAQRVIAANQAQKQTFDDSLGDPSKFGVNMYRDAEGWKVETYSGSIIKMESAEAAARYVHDLKLSFEEYQAETVIALADDLVKAFPGTRLEFSPSQLSADKENGLVLFNPVTGQKTVLKDAKALENLWKEASAISFDSGNAPQYVLGQNFMEFSQSIARVFRDVSGRVNSVPQAITAMHEVIEAAWKKGLADGAWSVESTRQIIATLVPTLEVGIAKLGKKAQAQELLWLENAKKAVAEGNEDLIREVFSEMAVRTWIGRDSDGNKTGLRPGAILRAIDAAVLQEKSPENVTTYQRLRAWFKAVGAYLKGVVATAKIIRDAERNGTIDDFTGFLDKVLGIETATREENEVKDGVIDMAFSLAPELKSFSLSPQLFLSEPYRVYEKKPGATYASPVDKVRESLAELTESPVMHETNLAGARKLLSMMMGRMGRTRLFVTNDSALALGQGGAGIKITFNPARLNGNEPNSLQNQNLKAVGSVSREFIVEKFVKGAVQRVEGSKSAIAKLKAEIPLLGKFQESENGTSLERVAIEENGKPVGSTFSLAPTEQDAEVISYERSDKFGSSYLDLKDSNGNWFKVRVSDHDQRTQNPANKRPYEMTQYLRRTFAITQESPQDISILVDKPLPEQETKDLALAALSTLDSDARSDAIEDGSELEFDAREQYHSLRLQWAKVQTERNGGTPPTSEVRGILEKTPQKLAEAKSLLAKIGDKSSFSLSPQSGIDIVSDTLESWQDVFDKAAKRNPTRAMAIRDLAQQRINRLGEMWAADRWTAKGDKIRAVVEKRTKGSLDDEQAMREALRYQELLDAGMMTLTPDVLMAYSEGVGTLEKEPLISTMLNDNGKLMSKSEAARQGLPIKDLYDDAVWLPPQFYAKGGGIMPDVMANNLGFDTASEMWAALESSIKSHRNAKEGYAKAEAAVKAVEKQAREQAKAEAAAWRQEADDMQADDWSPRESLVRDMRVLNVALSAFPPEVRAKVTGGSMVKLAGLATERARYKAIKKALDRAIVETEKFMRKEYTAQVKAVFARYEPDAKSGEKPKGKLGPDVQEIYDAAKAALGLTAEQTQAELARLDSLIAADGITPEQELNLTRQRGLVELMGDWKNADSGRMAAALEALEDTLSEGWASWKLRQILIREGREESRKELRSATKKKGLGKERDAMRDEAATTLGKASSALLNLSSFSDVMKYAFGAVNKAKEFISRERIASNAYEDAIQVIGDRVQDFFTAMGGGSVIAGERIRYDLAHSRVKVGSGDSERNLTQMQGIQALLMWQQEDGRRHMEGPKDENGAPVEGKWSYDETWIADLESKLTPEAKSVKLFLQQLYSEEWAPLNAIYRDIHGINLPRHDLYAPLTVKPQQAKAGEMVDPVSGAAIAGSILTPGSLRSRNRTAQAEPDFRDALAVFLGHSRQMEHWKNYYQLAVDLSAVLGNREVMNAVEASIGGEGVTVLRKWIDAIAQGGFRDAAAQMEISQIMSRVAGRAATVALLGRISTLLVQSTQLAAASVRMPVGAYLKRLGKLTTGNLSWGDAIKSDFIQRRIKQAPPIIRQAMNDLGTASRPNAITAAVRYLGNLLSGADGLFTGGTYAILLDWHRTQGAKMGLEGAELKAYAHDMAATITEEVAQPVRMANRSLMELTSTNPLAKVSWAYSSEARQKIALFFWSAKTAKSNPAKFGKTAFLTFIVGGLVSQVLKNLWREAKGDDDEKKWSVDRLTTATLAGPLHGIPMASEIMGNPGQLSSIAWSKAALEDVLTGDADMQDVQTLLSVSGYFNDNLAGIGALGNLGFDFAKIIKAATEED
jgi:hypothetical protein